MKKLAVILGVLVLIFLGYYLYIHQGSQRSFDKDYPIPQIVIDADSAMLEHGKYLVFGPAHCAHCHSSMDNLEALEAGEEVDMTGGFEFELPIGSIFTPNITPDMYTGIGAYSDGQIYRMLRHNIRPDGQVCIDFMPFFNMTEYDIKSIIAYIKTRDPIKSERIPNDYNMLGKMVRTFSMQPSKPHGVIEEYIARDSTLAYGEYLCESVANCMGCHTERDMKTGEYIGEPYAGGFTFGPDKSTRGWTFITPNITPDPTTGVIAGWSEEQFINRMRGGRVHQYSPMPWGPFSRLSENDLKAIFRHLQTIPGVTRVNGSPATPPED